MFEHLEVAPPDPILGLTEAFTQDSNPKKVNLSVGVYKAADGTTPVLATVKEAERRILDSEQTKSYLGIDGTPEYSAAVQQLIFNEGHEVLHNNRAVTAQTPGGTGALRIAADLISKIATDSTVWLSDPTWANHANIFAAAGLPTRTYPYYDKEAKRIDFDAMMARLREVPSGDVVLFHACCHNPTGMDPDLNQWKAVGEMSAERGWTPLVDFAYQGFADGLVEDAQGLMQLMTPGCETIICSSFSKNFGLYRERTGALTIVGTTEGEAQRLLGHVKKTIRCNYSNPPGHGGLIVTTILNDKELRAQWEQEVTEMRDRINGMRELFVKTMKDKGVDQDFSFLNRQCGMFSFSGLTKEQVDKLRDDYAIYIVGSGRINVAGMTEGNMDYLCSAIADVLKS